MRNRTRKIGREGLLPLLVGCTLSVLGCDSNRTEASATTIAPVLEAPKATTATAPAPAPADPAPAAQRSYQEAEFSVALEGPTSGKAGETLTLQVTLEAAAGYKINQEYPLKFQIKKAEGVLPEKDTVLRADAAMDSHRATMPVKVKLQNPGSYELGGRLSFSVCKEGDASVCLLEKRELSTKLDAS